jgi:hypothetical protein
MKAVSIPSVISPGILVLAALAVAVIAITWRGVSLPLLASLKVNLAILLALGMAICAQGGIGRIAAAGQWSHPLAVVGYLLGAAILILAVGIFFSVDLPFLASQQQAFLLVAALIGVKVLNSLAHYYLFPAG